jgi:hypothetical protein
MPFFSFQPIPLQGLPFPNGLVRIPGCGNANLLSVASRYDPPVVPVWWAKVQGEAKWVAVFSGEFRVSRGWLCFYSDGGELVSSIWYVVPLVVTIMVPWTSVPYIDAPMLCRAATVAV